MKTRNTLVILAALACGLVQAATVTDDFNRADTVADTDASVSIGPGWMHAGDPAAAGMISSNQVLVTDIGESLVYLLLNAQVKTLNDGALTEFTFSGDVQINHASGGGWAGVVFNYQDNDNYYLFRYNGLGGTQVLRRNNGNFGVIGSGSFTHVAGRPYTITVASRESHVFEISVVDTVTATEVYAETNSADSLVTSEDGFGGFYAGPGGAMFDNFTLSTIDDRSPTAVIDNFTRANTTANHDASVSIGPHWQDGSGKATSLYHIQAKKAKIDVIPGGSAPWIIVNDELGTLNDGPGTNFTLMGTVLLNNPSSMGWAGLVFNYQDSANYYMMRFNGEGGIQMIRVVGGGVNTFVESMSFSHVPGHFYEVTITSSDPYQFNLTIRDTVTDTIVHSSGPHIDALGSFKDGLGGFYRTTGLEPGWDNFYIDSTGAPPPDSGYTQWADSWGTDIGTDQADPDGDGLLNIYEYGLGGDPTNGLDQGTSPEFEISGGQFIYIHPQVADPDSGINYHLELRPNLSIGSWTNAGYTVDGTNDTGFALDFVSNSTSTVESEKFIRLIIELN